MNLFEFLFQVKFLRKINVNEENFWSKLYLNKVEKKMNADKTLEKNIANREKYI